MSELQRATKYKQAMLLKDMVFHLLLFLVTVSEDARVLQHCSILARLQA